MPAPLAIAAIAAGGFIKGGGLGGIIGGGARKREEQEARQAQRAAEHDYFNFDFNQDVGPIDNPYLQIAAEQQEFDQRNIDQGVANATHTLQQAGRFGGVQALIGQQADLAQQSSQNAAALRAQGAQYVDRIRQQRLAQRYDQAGTLLGRADARLAAATRARQQAKAAIFKGIGGAVSAAAGAAGAGPGASFGEALNASGLVPTFGRGAAGATQQAAAAGGGTVGPHIQTQAGQDQLETLSNFQPAQIGPDYSSQLLPGRSAIGNYGTGTVDIGQIELGAGHGYSNTSQYGF